MKPRKKPTRFQRPRDHVQGFVQEFRTLVGPYGAYTAFSDFCEMSALAIANSVDQARRGPREDRYLRLINSYAKKEERIVFPSLLARVVNALEGEPQDFLGVVCTELKLLDRKRGQFFTPYHVSHMMAKMLLHDAQNEIDQHGFIQAAEPCCGPGGMTIALAHALLDQGINFQQRLHVTCQDIDRRMAWMCYIQASLMGVPAFVNIGNSFKDEVLDTFVTPMHFMAGWPGKLAGRREKEQAAAAQAATAAPDQGLAFPVDLRDQLPLAAE